MCILAALCYRLPVMRFLGYARVSIKLYIKTQ